MTNQPVVIVQPVEKSSSTKWIICAAVCIILVIAVIFVGVGLGVGLGIGLQKKSTSSSTTSTSDNTVLSAPIVNCIYINSSTCGCAATKPKFLSSRIVNGYSAAAHSWPWAVALYYNNALLCQGFLVTYEHVVTAAHCVSSIAMTSLQIYAGMYSRSTSTNRQIRNISSIMIHPNYSSIDFLNDIAIIKLAAPLITTAAVGICCLPSNPSLPVQGESAVIVGWGRTRAIEISSLPDTLQQAVIRIQQCDLGPNSDRQFCAAFGKSDTCQGDSGGPLMTAVNNSWTCTGIVSYGIGCGNGGYYTRVSYYRSFIDNTIRNM